MKPVIQTYSGGVIDFVDPRFRTRLDLPRTVGVSGTPQMVQSINRIFGRDVVFLT